MMQEWSGWQCADGQKWPQAGSKVSALVVKKRCFGCMKPKILKPELHLQNVVVDDKSVTWTVEIKTSGTLLVVLGLCLHSPMFPCN